MYLDTVYYGVAITHLGNNHIEYSAFHWSSVFFCVSVCVFVLITWLSVLSESSFLPSQLKEMPVRRTEASSIDHTVSTQRGLHLPHRQSRCHARCTRGPRGTCHRPRQGTRSRGSPSQTNCRSLEHGQNNMTYVKKKQHILSILIETSLISPVSMMTVFIITHLVHSTALRPPGGRCCSWLAADRKRRESSRHATSVWGRLSPPVGAEANNVVSWRHHT